MDDSALLRSIPAIRARLPQMSRQDLVVVWGHAVEAQARTEDVALKSAIEHLLDAVDAEFAAPGRQGQKDRLEEGPLGFLGYHVGRSAGLAAKQRQARLSAIYRRTIPPVFPPNYLVAWGQPGTPQRLQRMALALAGFIRDPKRRRDERMEDAIAEWKEDLAYLHRTHHRGEFRWPEA